jgi:DNA-binding MarR family transcriptional regulator
MRTKCGEADPRYRALIELLRTADTIWDASRVFFGRWDLSPSQFNVLNLLRLSGGGLSQTDLSRQLIMHRSNVTGLVDRLEKRGLVARQDAAGDRRAYSVVLTAAGAALLRQILPLYYRGANAAWSHVSARRASELTGDLRQVAQNAQQIAGSRT